MEAAAERIERELGPIDVWVNNAFSSVAGGAAVAAVTGAVLRRSSHSS